jgi:cytoskeletal protein CcmA (bactofilin family)
MFNKTTKTEAAAGTSINLIGNGTTISGDVNANGDIRIDGILTGNINITGKLVIGSSGKIEGNIICQNADVSGEVNGTIQVSDLLALKATAKVLGDITTGKLSIEPNAVFTGTCKMGAIVKTISQKNETREAKTA